MIEIKNLNKIYLKGKKNMVHALNNINLKIDDRETVAIIGESGAGKSTLLHIMSCIDNFDGEYYLDNIDINKLSESKKSKLRSSKIGIVLQDFALIDDFTVFENVMTPLYFNKKIKDKKGSVMRALKKTGIVSLKAKKVSQLSGGQKQRVAISRALVTSPEYIFADEPTVTANCSIHKPPTYHAPNVPATTAGKEIQRTSCTNISNIANDSAPFTLRIAISFERRCNSSLI